jgi:two-component system response regulator FixJ
MELIAALRKANDPRPIILLTAHGDVELAVQALKLGAFDFIEKPFEEDRLLQAIAAAIAHAARTALRQNELAELRRRYDSLTERQKEVLWLVVDGCSNKEVAARLKISVRTVETYRAWVLERMQSKSFAELVRASMLLREALDQESGTGS